MPTDTQLMLQVREGRTADLGILFERHHAKMYAFFQRMTADRQLSEDLVQELFLRALRYRDAFRADSEFLPWLYRMARNLCIDHLRRRKRSPEIPGELPAAAGVPPRAAAELEGQEAADLLRRALAQLPPDKREVLVLARLERRAAAEIAELLECSAGAVRVRVHRALKELRRVYGQLAATGAQEVTP